MSNYICHCGREHFQSSWKFCPSCGAAKKLQARDRKVYPVEGAMGRRMRDKPVLVAFRGSEFRPPKKGEYYLSGARPVAYKAPNDLSQAYRIAQIEER